MESPFLKVKKIKAKGGGTKKVCLPLAKIRSMSNSDKNAVVRAKRSAGAKGDYKRSSKSNVKGTYLIYSRAHVSAMVDGKMYDWGATSCKRVKGVYTVVPV